MKTQLTIAEIANITDGKLWTKGTTERCYYNQFGHTTKKMKTTAYSYIVDGEIKVSVFVECNSQPMSWCIKEADRVKETIIEHIEGCLEEITA